MHLRVYSDPSHYAEAHRKALNDIVKAHWTSATLDERRAAHGKLPELFEVVTDPDAADLHILTMRWQHYVEHGRVDQALRSVELARKLRKPLAVFSLSDFEANFPATDGGVHLFQASAYRSRRTTGNHAIPAFIEDPLVGFRDGKLNPRNHTAKPSLGFCGQAGGSLVHHGVRLVRNRLKRLSWKLGRERWEPPPLEHTWFRQRVLDTFATSTKVEARYVLRKKYRAGLSQATDRNDPAQRARREFLENVDATDYTICMRGGGNFSIRFYEALALGRIPAFIDTDCVVPFHDRVDWKHFTVWIDERDLSRAPELVASFHARMSPAEYVERQRECRRLWEERLTTDGFYAHFYEHFPELAR